MLSPPMKRKAKQKLAETDKGSYYNQDDWFEKYLDNSGMFYNYNESDSEHCETSKF